MPILFTKLSLFTTFFKMLDHLWSKSSEQELKNVYLLILCYIILVVISTGRHQILRIFQEYYLHAPWTHIFTYGISGIH